MNIKRNVENTTADETIIVFWPIELIRYQTKIFNRIKAIPSMMLNFFIVLHLWRNRRRNCA